MNRDAVVARRTEELALIHPVADFSRVPSDDHARVIADHLEHTRRLVIR